jgi:hypothetical protein
VSLTERTGPLRGFELVAPELVETFEELGASPLGMIVQ